MCKVYPLPLQKLNKLIRSTSRSIEAAQKSTDRPIIIIDDSSSMGMSRLTSLDMCAGQPEASVDLLGDGGILAVGAHLNDGNGAH